MSRRLGIAATTAAALVIAVMVGGLQATSGGYIASVTNSADTTGSAPTFTCVQGATQDSAVFAYLLNDSSTSVVADSSGNARNGTYLNARSTASAVTSACRRDPAGAYVLAGLSGILGTNSFAVSPQLTAPSAFSLELWFKTATTASHGQLMGFGNSNSAALGSSTYNRELYLSTTGNLVFGVTSATTIASPLTYSDTNWHHVIVTVSSTTARMWVDGANVASGPAGTVTAASGYWHLGFDVLLGWPNTDLINNAFTGSMRFAALYPTALSATAVANHYRAGSPAP